MPVPVPAPPGFAHVKHPISRERTRKTGISTFTRIWPRRGKNKRRGPNPRLKRYGLLRRMALLPFWVGALQYRLVMLVDSLAHSVLAILCGAELLGLDILRGRQSSVLARPLGSARRLASLVYDSCFGMAQLLCTLPRFFFSFPDEDMMTVFRRLAILQCCFGALLHYSSVVRWKTRSCEYRVPPLLILVAYFVLPWTNLCSFLLLVRPGDHQLGSRLMEFLILMTSAGLRVALFGRYGRPRMPRAPQSYLMRFGDAVVLGLAVYLLDAALLRNAWIERRKNWKFVFCLLLLALPLPFWRHLLRFFREERDGVKMPKAVKKERITREDVRAEIYGKLRPGVPVGADLPTDVTQKLRARRAFERSRGQREVARTVPKLPVLGLKASHTGSKADE
ncbi:unnamed protein product [Durusdinium trenchii]|uniref:Chloroplastic n=2 Tax=Durusdinium trenchii TaxID=1381693 RepID=A0ABP0RAL3_9DINO